MKNHQAAFMTTGWERLKKLEPNLQGKMASFIFSESVENMLERFQESDFRHDVTDHGESTVFYARNKTTVDQLVVLTDLVSMMDYEFCGDEHKRSYQTMTTDIEELLLQRKNAPGLLAIAKPPASMMYMNVRTTTKASGWIVFFENYLVKIRARQANIPWSLCNSFVIKRSSYAPAWAESMKKFLSDDRQGSWQILLGAKEISRFSEPAKAKIAVLLAASRRRLGEKSHIKHMNQDLLESIAEKVYESTGEVDLHTVKEFYNSKRNRKHQKQQQQQQTAADCICGLCGRWILQ